jgi:hypothetical protein
MSEPIIKDLVVLFPNSLPELAQSVKKTNPWAKPLVPSRTKITILGLNKKWSDEEILGQLRGYSKRQWLIVFVVFADETKKGKPLQIIRMKCCE